MLFNIIYNKKKVLLFFILTKIQILSIKNIINKEKL